MAEALKQEVALELKPEIDQALPAAEQFARVAEQRASACIALEDAVECVDCSLIYERFSAHCPKCASDVQWGIAQAQASSAAHIADLVSQIAELERKLSESAPGAVEDATGRP